MMGGRAPTPRDEPDQGKAQDGPEGWQTRGGRSSGHLGRPECWSQQTTARPRPGSAVAPKFMTSRTVHTTNLGREIGIAERLGDQINPGLQPAMMHKGVARGARREQHLQPWSKR